MEGCCPICNRPLGEVRLEDHHLLPKTFGGRETICVHGICHQKLHSAITEREMQHYYHTVERLLEHEEIQKFVKWVSNKSPELHSVNRDTHDRKKKRKR